MQNKVFVSLRFASMRNKKTQCEIKRTETKLDAKQKKENKTRCETERVHAKLDAKQKEPMQN